MINTPHTHTHARGPLLHPHSTFMLSKVQCHSESMIVAECPHQPLTEATWLDQFFVWLKLLDTCLTKLLLPLNDRLLPKTHVPLLIENIAKTWHLSCCKMLLADSWHCPCPFTAHYTVTRCYFQTDGNSCQKLRGVKMMMSHFCSYLVILAEGKMSWKLFLKSCDFIF